MQAWERFLQHLEAEMGAETIQRWLRTLKILRFDACNLYLEAKDSFQALWYEEHISSKAKTLLFNGNNHLIKVHINVAKSPPQNKQQAKNKVSKSIKEPSFRLKFDELDPLCTFEHFIVGQENDIAYQLFEQLGKSHNPSPLNFNPIYLYGSPGCGKTHLLMSLVHAYRSLGQRSIYVRAELFTDHVVTAIRAGEMSTFRQAYRNTDILLVDDVQVFSRKGATQEEFFHTFNTLHLEGKQIIITANCPPQELTFIEPRLISRFEWGVVLPLKSLEPDERLKLLQTKAKALQFPLSAKLATYLIDAFPSSPKALTRALEALILRLHAEDQKALENLSVQTAKNLLSDLLAEEQKSALTATKIAQKVAEHFGIRVEDILGKSQTRECSLPRQMAMHLCRHQLKMPFTKIGDLFSRDHSTVMTSVKFIQQALHNDDAEISGAWNTVLKKLAS